jgi:hypothetical protein
MVTYTTGMPKLRRFIDLKTFVTKDDSTHLSLQITRIEAKKIRFDRLKKNEVGNVGVM